MASARDQALALLAQATSRPDLAPLLASPDWDELLALRAELHARPECAEGQPGRILLGDLERLLGLRAPAPWAAHLLDDRFTGVRDHLWEFVAQRFTWAELAPHLPPGRARTLCAYERVLRGEDLSGDASLDPRELGLPFHLEPWEPAYPLPQYEERSGSLVSTFGGDRVEKASLALPAPGAPLDEPGVREALEELVRPWYLPTAAGVRGEAPAAIAAVLAARSAKNEERGASVAWGEGGKGIECGPVELAWALERMALAAGGSAPYIEPRGVATGRVLAWRALAGVAGLLDAWPIEPDRLGEAGARLRWFAYEPHASGCLRVDDRLFLAVDDPASGRAWALYAWTTD